MRRSLRDGRAGLGLWSWREGGEEPRMDTDVHGWFDADRLVWAERTQILRCSYMRAVEYATVCEEFASVWDEVISSREPVVIKRGGYPNLALIRAGRVIESHGNRACAEVTDELSASVYCDKKGACGRGM